MHMYTHIYTHEHIHEYLDDLAVVKDQVLSLEPFCLLKNILLTQHLMKQFHNTRYEQHC